MAVDLSVRSFFLPSPELWTWHCENECVEFDANWHRWSTGQDDETINFWDQEVKDQRHTTPWPDYYYGIGVVGRAVFAGGRGQGGLNPLHKITNPPTRRPIMSREGLTATPLPTPLFFCSVLVRTENCENVMLLPHKPVRLVFFSFSAVFFSVCLFWICCHDGKSAVLWALVL